MNKILLSLGIMAIGVLMLPRMALAVGERIISFDVAAIIQSDSSMQVSETIVYDFGTAERHGIYRDIPYAYSRDGSSYKVRLSIDAVTNESGDGYQYSTSRSDGELHVKIGNPDMTISGIHTYVINYTVVRGINHFDNHDELYWNVTGNGWGVGIDEASMTAQLPQSLTADERLTECFTGAAGSTDRFCTIDSSDERLITYSANTILGPYEGLTVVLGWPKGITVEPDAWQRIAWFLADNWFVAIPFVIIFGMLGIWYSRGRDPQGRGTIIPQYDAPDDLSAGIVGTVVDERADLRDISATIIQLAVKGYLTITRIEKKKLIGSSADYEFMKKKEADSSLDVHETKVLEAVFGSSPTKKMSALKNKFYKDLPEIKKAMYQRVVELGYFPTNPDRVRLLYSGFGIAFVIFAFSFVIAANVAAGIMTAIAGFVAIIIAQVMPRKTKKGVEAKEHILGLKWFLSVTEKERLKFHNAPEKSPKEFEQFLPYAMALQVEQQWAEQFKDMYRTPPEWYDGGSATAFNAILFTSAMSDLSKNFSSVATSKPSSAGSGGSGFSGGGFSGGGFGGGGGGSW